MRSHRLALFGGVALAALLTFGVWGVWAVAQPQVDAFVLPGARDIRHQSLGPGLFSVTFVYDGSVLAQTMRLRTTLDRRGWQASLPQRPCGDACILGEAILVYTRVSPFNVIREVATIEQRGSRPFRVRVVLRRCYQLPWVGCWPVAE
jgi:hypothetical protein